MKEIEIGGQAKWTISTCKTGFGVNNLRDRSLSTYWQSDGSQPHSIQLEFHKKTTLNMLKMYLDYKQDES